eukprot:6207645-Pleurochrysis_carterae.AAC.1
MSLDWYLDLRTGHCNMNTEQPLEGRARFEPVARTNSVHHARLSWRALQIKFSIYRELTRATIWAGWERRENMNTYRQGLGEGACARAEAPLCSGSRRGRSKIGSGHRERVPRAWGAKRERSASTHAMRCKNGKPCM